MTSLELSLCPIVMVDDNEPDRFIVATCLAESQLAHPWLEFPGARPFLEFLERVKTEQEPMPLLVLLDINMPVMNGFELYDRLRADPYFASVPVVMMLTSSSDERDIQQAQERGAARFLKKSATLDNYVSFFDALDLPGIQRRA